MPARDKMLNAIVKPSGLVIDGSVVTEAPRLDDVLVKFASPAFREREMHDQGRLWRKFVILDGLGIYLLYDFEVERVLDVTFCFAHSKSPASPTDLFSGLIFVNGARLVPGMRERFLPVTGEFHFSKHGGWDATSERVFVQMRLSPRNKRLGAISVSFLKRPQFACERK
jgi:hypothetical protein